MHPILRLIALIQARKRSAQLYKLSRIFLGPDSYKEANNSIKSQQKRIIIANSTHGNPTITSGDLFIAEILRRQGHDILYAVCDSSLAACSMVESKKYLRFKPTLEVEKQLNCKSCNKRFGRDYFPVGFVHKSVEWGYLDEHEHEEINFFLDCWNRSGDLTRFRSIKVHEHSLAGLVRYYGQSIGMNEIINSEAHKRNYANFLKAACEVVVNWEKILVEKRPEIVVINHGLYVPQGPIADTCKKWGIKTSIWHYGYRKNTIVVSRGDTYHKTLLKEQSFKGCSLSQRKRDRVLKYLEGRKDGSADQISFAHKDSKAYRYNRKENEKYLYKCLVLTNVEWDAQCHYKNNVYANMREWLRAVYTLAQKRKDTLFIVRCHPAEVTGKRLASSMISDYLKQSLQALDNFLIIEATNKVSTYSLISHCDICIVYATKTAVEAVAMGKPVLVCGESCIRNKGLTVDLKCKESLFDSYNYALGLSVDIEGALSYAYHLYFEVMQDFDNIDPTYFLSPANIKLAEYIAWDR